MANVHAPAHGVMEGKGAYNKWGKLPADGAALALPLLEKAVQDLEVEPGEQAIVIADYGSSQGKNSLPPMQLAIRCLRNRLDRARPISVFHVDQPSNDFNSLFGVLAADPDGYIGSDPNVYAAAIGRSFYEKVLPSNSVHLGWSSYAAQWLSQAPTLIPDHFISILSSNRVLAEFERQAARDWETFLQLRARELRPGGRLVVVLPGMADDGQTGLESLFQVANSVLGEMVSDGAITAAERSRMTLAAHPRRRRELLAPFATSGEFHRLRVEDLWLFELPDSAWAQYERDGDGEALAARRAAFFRSVFAPSLACALASARPENGEAVDRFSHQLEQRLKSHLANQPAAINSYVETILLAKS